MENFKKAGIVFIVGIVMGLLLCRSCGEPCPTNQLVTTDTVRIYDNTEHHYYHDSTILKYTSTIREIPAGVDSEEVARRYFAMNVYTDSINDSTLSVEIRDSITENRIMNRLFTYKINRPFTSIVNRYDTCTTQPRRRLFIGTSGAVPVKGDGTPVLEIGAAYGALNGNLVQVGYDTQGRIRVGYFWRFGK